ncbi:MAG: hypothetical protein ACRC6E_03710 [Fusobacteriaceae bacterium]
MKPTFTLIEGYIPFVFVVPPTDLSITTEMGSKSISIIDLGEMVRSGKVGATRINFSGFFPSIKSHFYDAILNSKSSLVAVEYLKHKMKEGTIFKFAIPEWGTFLNCKIESFSESYTDHTGDIYYSISLVEERTTESLITNIITGLLGRG